jgi:phage baseplate assembly protein gpV
VSAALFDSVSRIARHEAGARPTVSVGVVADTLDSGGAVADHAVTVELREAGIVLPRVPIAVGALGLAAIPAPGDLVVVAFADGDYHAPMVLGRLYHADLSPPEHTDGEVVLELPPGASSPAVRAVVRGRAPHLEVEVGSQVKVAIDDETVSVKAGDAEAVLEAGGGGRAELSVGEATLTISGRGDIEISTPGEFKVQAAQVDIQGSATAKVAAPQVQIN